MIVWQDLLARAHRAPQRELAEGRPPADNGPTARPDLTERGDHFQHGRPRVSGVLLVGAALVAALAVDWFLVTWSYPVAAAYGVSLLVAAHVLSPRGVAVTTGLALVLSVVSNNLQGAPAAAWLADNTSLVGLGVLACLLARQREVTQAAREASDAAKGRIELAYEAARALAEATTLEEAGSALLASIGPHLAWTCGALWCLDESGDALVCVATWHRPGRDLSAFERQLCQTRIEPRVGLPGRVWASGQPLWIPDLQREANFPRRAASLEAGLRTVFGFPIRRASDILGVMEFFDARLRQPDDALLGLMDALGAQIGLFLARRQAEDQVAALLERERRARSEADAALQVRDEFLASASHDLRGPLTAIHGYAALARRRLEAGGGERAEAALTSIQASVKRLTGALDELLDLAQLQAGQRLALRRAPTDLVALVRRVAADHEVATEQSSIQVQSDVPDLIGGWDAARVERALGNLVGNALKYSPPGGEVRVVISRREDARGAWAVVRVQDRGIGIPAADLPRIFERFHRATNVSGRVPGTGLGLPGAREIVEQHGGDISAESQEGHGSTFTMWLPLDAEETGTDAWANESASQTT
jgi:signal transduction histidine kinase